MYLFKLLIYGLIVLPIVVESCLPSWLRASRSVSAEPLRSNEIIDNLESTTATNDEYEYVDDEAEESGEAIKYNEEADDVTSTLTPEVQKEIGRLKDTKCKGYCHHNATCHVEVIFRDNSVAAVVPSCHCPVGWEGARCDKRYVQAFYAPVSENYNESDIVGTVTTTARTVLVDGNVSLSKEIDGNGIFGDVENILWKQSSSTIPAFAFLLVMLAIFIAIVLYAYKRMARRFDETTYTMSHMCPPEAFSVLKTPNGRRITVQEPLSIQRNGVVRLTSCGSVMRGAPETPRRNFFTILRHQGTIPSRSIKEEDTPRHYRSVPRIDVSAINCSGHLDFSQNSCPVGQSESQPKRNGANDHVAIPMDDLTSSAGASQEDTPPTMNLKEDKILPNL